MTDASYIIIRQVSMGLLLYLGFHMLLISLPQQLTNSFFKRSLKVMGCAFTIVPLSCFIYTPDHSLELEPYISAAVNLTAYFWTSLLMTIAFLILLGRKFGKAFNRLIVANIIIFPLPAWLSLASGNIKLIDTVITASYTYFILALFLMVAAVLHNCAKATKNIDNYYSDDLNICVSWIQRSMWLLGGLAINCGISPFLPISPWWLRAFFLVYGMSCYLHIRYGYRRMMIAMIDYFMMQGYSIQDLAIVEQSKDTAPTISAEIQDRIQEQLELWISAKGYIQRGLTINIVAKEIGTNRTYLSRYINTTYQCSFKAWVTQLRVEEAQRLLLDDMTMTVSKVSEIIGFASVESFAHIFARTTGASPTAWREKNSIKIKGNR